MICKSNLVYKNETDGWSCWNQEKCQDAAPFLNTVQENGKTINQCIDYCAGTKPYNFEGECFEICPTYTNKYG